MPQARGEPTDVELRERIAAWLRFYMARHGLNQRELAQALDLSEPSISVYVRGLKFPGLDTFVRMHFRFGADMERMVRQLPPAATPLPPPVERDRKKA